MSTHALPDSIVFMTTLPTGDTVIQTLIHPHRYNLTGAEFGVEIEILCENYTVDIAGKEVHSQTGLVTIRGRWSDEVTFRFGREIGPRDQMRTQTIERFVALLLGIPTWSGHGPRPIA